MTRADSRTAQSLRPLALTQSLLSRADGSAKFSFGPLSVLASITGPTEVRIRDELVDRATLEIHVRPLRSLSGPAQKAQETLLLSLLSPLILLHLHPRSLIQLTLQTLSSPSTAFSHAFSTDPVDNPLSPSPEVPLGVGAGTAEKAAQVNAGMLALVDAGIECRGMVVGVAVAFVRGEMLLDPSPREEEEATSAHLFVFSFGVGVGGTEGECVGVDSVGRFDEDELFDAQDLAAKAAQGVLAFVRKSIEARYGVKGVPVKKESFKLKDEEEEEEEEEDGMDVEE